MIVALTIARWALIIVFGIAAIWISLFILVLIYAGLRRIYHVFNPSARERFLILRTSQKAATEQRERDAAACKAEEERQKNEQILAGRRALEERVRVAKEANILKELARQHHRDADIQECPYTYEIGQHANEALAIRYGIANQNYKKITLKKLQPLSRDQYIAALSDHGDRKVRVVIELGTEYVKTFLPLDDAWFDTYKKLEETLKNNKSFSLKELASFHVQKVL